ncbi:hypothetical protein Tco_1278169, partial [Tanacetum coccineum]
GSKTKVLKIKSWVSSFRRQSLFASKELILSDVSDVYDRTTYKSMGFALITKAIVQQAKEATRIFNRSGYTLEDETRLSIKGDVGCTYFFSSMEATQSVSHILMVDEGKSGERVELAIRCLLHLDPASNHGSCSTPFRCKKIRDTVYSYRQKLATPSMVAEYVICVITELAWKINMTKISRVEYQHYKKPNDGTTGLFVNFRYSESLQFLNYSYLWKASCLSALGHNIILEYARETIFCCLKPMVHGEHMEIEAKDLTGNNVSSIAERQTNFINDSGSHFLKTSVKT